MLPVGYLIADCLVQEERLVLDLGTLCKLKLNLHSLFHYFEYTLSLGIGGGAEQSGHTEDIKHYSGQAADIHC
jgi:hypothetical protein